MCDSIHHMINRLTAINFSTRFLNYKFHKFNHSGKNGCNGTQFKEIVINGAVYYQLEIIVVYES